MKQPLDDLYSFPEISGDEYKIYKHEIYCGWINKDIHVPCTLQWHECRFTSGNRDSIPDSQGLYAFVLKHNSGALPGHGIIVYIGETGSFRRRFGEYLSEKNSLRGRPKLISLLNQYDNNITFSYAHTNNTTENERKRIERLLYNTIIPRANTKFDAKIAQAIGAF